jgi:N-acetylglucosaminyl-diphospho-decaprenol L-rhamnosyltransferase
MRLLVVTVNYRTPEMTLDAVRALMPELASLPDARVAIVDNDSGDGSLQKLAAGIEKEGWRPQVALHPAPRNGGFAYGNNYVIRRALTQPHPPDYVYLLNSDAFPEPGGVQQLIRFLEQNPDAGIAGSAVHGTDGAPHHSAFRFPSLASEFERAFGLGLMSRVLARWVVAQPIPTERTPVDWTVGASMMIRREVFDAIGLFDERFFLYYEETDFCRRARYAGWPTWFVPESRVAHIGSATTGVDREGSRLPGYWFESRKHYFAKNHGRLYLALANVLWLCGHLAWQVRRRIQRVADRQPPHILRDFLHHNLGIGSAPASVPAATASPQSRLGEGARPSGLNDSREGNDRGDVT